MESDCRICARTLAVYIVLCSWISFRVLGASVLRNANASDTMIAETTPCWQNEEFVVSAKCSPCNDFQSKVLTECKQTGYVEKIICAKSHKDEYKSCRSAEMEEHRFWKFEGTMLGLTVVFALLVVSRQRALDRLASEKVRKQIESI
ncbi:hypothetical protein AGOR_G00209610 [Albula goreensis]|uniref:Protein JTB n=1 Tax=Albula goreensis TaxID=1534307 RepID=A0A8T3CQC5_9TELE|nr:hypothetical protein AGOR_G00209610 [Albula goreensis]